MEASSSTAQQNSPQGNTNDQVSDDVIAVEQLLKEMEIRQDSRQGNINDQVSVDVIAITLSLTERFEQLHHVSRERCIYRVQKRLKQLNEKAYKPRCVSIGPYHHGKDELKAMEEHKIMYLQHFLRLSKVSLKIFVWCVRKNETRLRNCYEERIDLSSERFVELMVVDAAFVLMVMLRRYAMQFPNEDELLFNNPRMINDSLYDMILLENQLPFFILQEFIALSNLLPSDPSMIKLSSNFLGWACPSLVVIPSKTLNLSKSKHLVDFLRIGQLPLEQNRHKCLDVVNLPGAVELHRAGVKFKRGSSQRLVNINFCDGILEIPVLQLDENTETVFRNLQAFEQSHVDSDKTYFNNYIFMINFLVTNEKDVEFLTKERIIQNWFLDNEQVVHILHNLVKENIINSNKFYFTDVVNGLNKYYSKKRNRWRASFIHNYFYTPWAIVSVIAATLLLLLTIVQTICSILQVKQQQ